ncbi:MAG: YihY family inner membrane protein [Gammaproteobacteria bacterium]|nr:YihY family inner membrane protein [Gammaproteobacteria bacterium]
MFTGQVLKSIFKQCINDRCPQIAASLAYATLLALIPLSVITYKIYTTAFIDPVWQLKVQTFVFESLSPSTAEQVRQYLFNNAIQASSINIIGLFMLLVSVIVLMSTIDSALNSIWKIHAPRYLARRIFVYLTLLIFGPLAIYFSLFASTYITSLSLIAEYLGESSATGMFSWMPFIILWIAFTMLYKFVPDCKVKWLHAFSGGTTAVCLFEIAKSIFALYLSYFQTYELLYGALASIPILLVWIYLTWFIVLIGAEIAHFMQIIADE